MYTRFLLLNFGLFLMVLNFVNAQSSNRTAFFQFDLTRISVVQPNSLARIAGMDDSHSWTWNSLTVTLEVLTDSGRCLPPPSTLLPKPNSNYTIFEGDILVNCTFDLLSNFAFFADLDGNLSVSQTVNPQVPLCRDHKAVTIALSDDSNEWISESQTICSGNFTADFSYKYQCTSEGMYGSNCDVYCVDLDQGDGSCYHCANNGSKICCPNHSGDQCLQTSTPSGVSTTTNEAYYEKDNKLWYILTIVFGCLAGLLLLILIALIIYLICKRSRKNRNIHPASKPPRSKRDDPPIMVKSARNTATDPVVLAFQPSLPEPNQNSLSTSSIIYRPPQQQQQDPMYTEIRRLPPRLPPAATVERNESTISSTVIEVPTRDDPRRRPIIGTPVGLSTQRYRDPVYEARPVIIEQRNGGGNESDPDGTDV